MNIRQLLAKNVKLYRDRLGYSQDALADQCAKLRESDALFNRSYISDIENCRRNVALDKIELLAEALEVEPYMLFVTKEDTEKL